MTSEIRANTLKNRVGLGTVSFTNTGPVVSGIVTANTLRLPDATSGSLGRVQLGNGLHFSMYHNGSNSFLVNNNGYLSIQSQAGVNGIFIARNAEVNLYFGPSVRLQTSSVGVTINKDLDVDGHTNLDNVSVAGITTFSGNVHLLDNDYLRVGGSAGSQDGLDIYHNGSHSYIKDAGTGRLILQSSQLCLQDTSGNNHLIANPGGSVQIYHDFANNGTAKILTNSIGAQINTTLLVSGAAGNPGRLRLQEGGALSEIRVGRSSDTSSELYFDTEISGTTATRAKIDTAGHFIPATDSTYDLGLTGTRWRNLYADTLYGDGSNLTSLPTQITINNNANGRIITASGNANEVDAQTSLFFTAGSDPKLTISGTGHAQLNLTSTGGTDHTGINFGDSADINAGMIQYSNTGNAMQFHTNGGEKLRIDSSGRLGLGTNNPDTLLHLKAASGSTLQRFESSSYSSYIAQIQANDNVGNGSLAGNLYLRGQSGVQMSGNGGTATQFALDGTALSITGTTDGVLNLDTSDSRGSFIRFKQGGATEAWVGCGEGLSLGTSTTLAFRSDADIRIRTGAEEHVTITTEGMFAAKGQAGSWIYGNHPANYTGFHQFSSSKNGDWMMQFRQEHHNGLGFNMRVANNGNNEAIALYRENTSTYGFKVYQNGNVQNSNNSYGQLSDITLKENITDSNSQWDDIKAVKVRNYNFKDDPDKVNMIGVVAQEIETVSPKLVWEDKEGLKGVAYSVLYMKAIKALQEAMTKIETLEQDNIALRARVTNLEGN